MYCSSLRNCLISPGVRSTSVGRRFATESALLDAMNSTESGLMDTLNTGDWNDDIEAGFKAALDKFAATQSW